jgi:hypothetical protein
MVAGYLRINRLFLGEVSFWRGFYRDNPQKDEWCAYFAVRSRVSVV